MSRLDAFQMSLFSITCSIFQCGLPDRVLVDSSFVFSPLFKNSLRPCLSSRILNTLTDRNFLLMLLLWKGKHCTWNVTFSWGSEIAVILKF